MRRVAGNQIKEHSCSQKKLGKGRQLPEASMLRGDGKKDRPVIHEGQSIKPCPAERSPMNRVSSGALHVLCCHSFQGGLPRACAL